MLIERKAYPVSGIKADDQSGVIEAIVSVFNNVDSGKEIVRPGFFSKSVAKKLPKGVWMHDWKQPIAKTLEAKELAPGDASLPESLKALGGLYIKGQLNLGTQRGREAYSDIKFGIVDEFSVGYKVLKESKDEKTGARELIEGDLKEWSPVLVGMNPETQLLSIKQEELERKLWEETANEIRYRVKDPGQFQSNSFRTITLQQSPKINAIIGKLDGETTTTIQSLRFAADDWSMADAKKWVTDHADKIKSSDELLIKAEWTTQYMDDLPDSSFAYIESGGQKDQDGKTTPRSLRHFPYKNANGDLDEAHVRNALARIPQSKLPQAAKDAALRKVEAAARQLGIQLGTGKADPLMVLSSMASKIAQAAKTVEVTGFDWQAKVDEACAEYGQDVSSDVKNQIHEFLDNSDDEFYLKGIAGTESFESFEAAGAALQKFARKMRSNHEIRLKEGRMLSTSNRAKVQSCMDSLMALHSELNDLMNMSEPKPKVDVSALRTQSLRLRGQALRTLAHK